jgi:hypothetical protein
VQGRPAAGGTGAPATPIGDPGSSAVAAGVARREADGSVVFLPPVQRAAAGAAGRAGPVAAGPVSAGPAPGARTEPAAVQRFDPPSDVLDPAPPSPEAASPSVVAPAPGPATAAAGPGAAAPGAADLDELVRRLFDPLSARLKDELRLDRERAGLVTDVRW